MTFSDISLFYHYLYHLFILDYPSCILGCLSIWYDAHLAELCFARPGGTIPVHEENICAGQAGLQQRVRSVLCRCGCKTCQKNSVSCALVHGICWRRFPTNLSMGFEDFEDLRIPQFSPQLRPAERDPILQFVKRSVSFCPKFPKLWSKF